jgi:predicted ATP-binding protein involved in virulence
MMLRELVVEDLFGDFTHTVPFKIADGLTLLHGPNGVGKTTVLRLLDCLFNRRLRQLRSQPFGVMRIEFDNGDRLQVTKKTAEEDRPASLEFIITPMSNKHARSWTFKAGIHVDIALGVIEDVIPDLVRTGQREWTISTTGEILDFDDVLDRYERYLPVRESVRNSESPKWLDELLDRVPVFFIEADRLSTYGRSPRIRRTSRELSHIPTVNIYANELAEQIRRTLASYADSSQTLDSTFPTRLLQSDSQARTIPSDEEIRSRYEEQAERRNRYVRTGLLDAGDELQLPEGTLDPTDCRVLDTYLKDVDLKLDKLDDLAGKLELFLSIVNGKFRRKSIRVDRERGLIASTSTNQPLELPSLSSGEQQEIVLAYGLLFREKPGTMILLDEPELSLHVSWQMDLIPDLLKIADLAGLEFLIATHSPQIVNDRWDLTVQLSDEQPE